MSLPTQSKSQPRTSEHLQALKYDGHLAHPRSLQAYQRLLADHIVPAVLVVARRHDYGCRGEVRQPETEEKGDDAGVRLG
jgi:hypothetical protein